MRISDWSSDVCSSDLGQRLESRHLGRAARFGGADVGFRGVDLLVRRFDVGIAVQRDRDRVLGGGGQVRQLRRRLQIDRRLADEADIALAAGDQIGLGGRSEEHTSELQSLMRNTYDVFCLKKKKK